MYLDVTNHGKSNLSTLTTLLKRQALDTDLWIKILIPLLISPTA